VKRLTKIAVALLIAIMAVAALPAQAAEAWTSVPIADDAVFFHTEDGIEVWTPDADGNWGLTLSLTNDEIEAVEANPDETLLVAQAGVITVYKSPNGEFSVANGPDAEGKIRVVVFDSAFGYSHQYENSIYGEVS
jgi:hypothetical protein